MRRLSFVVALLLLVVLAGCVREEFGTCVDDPSDPRCIVDAGDAGVRDAGDGGRIDASDGGEDLGDEDLGTDAGPCGMACPVATPVCDVTSGACVECAAGDAAACTGGTPVCDVATNACVECTPADATACTAGTPVCDTATNVCVGCLANADCGTASAARCDLASHACAPCGGAIDCAHLPGTLVCDTGMCVTCTATDETACGANSCDPAMRTCTATPRASVRTCGACVADSECLADNRCVPMMFMGAARMGGYCLKRAATGCAEPYTVPAVARASLSGAATEIYCGVNEIMTTCDAVLHLIDNRACAAGTDTDCGAAGLADGLCRTVSFVMNRCTYACSTAAECPSTRTCTAGYCGS